MSIVKDLLLISLFLIVVIRYILLYKDMLKQKEYFIKTLNHDLRVSTLAQIRGLELLEKQEKNELVSNINDSCKYTLDMINMLLKTYRYENGEQVLNYEKFKFSEILNGCREKLSSLAEEKDVRISYKSEDSNTINADKTEILKVFLTLISASIFNAERKSSIEVVIKRTRNIYEITVNYSGKPLTEEECRRMFSKNPRFSTVGHGIKMYLCKKIIEFHGGKIYVTNHNNKTNAFTFTLPCTKKASSFKLPVLVCLQPYNQ